MQNKEKNTVTKKETGMSFEILAQIKGLENIEEDSFHQIIPNGEKNMFLHVPVYAKFINNTNKTKAVQNLKLCAYCNGKKVAVADNIVFIAKCETKFNLGENEKYSFEIPKMSFKTLNFTFSLSSEKLKENDFDELRIEYVDENEEVNSYHLIDMDGKWIERIFVTTDKVIKLR